MKVFISGPMTGYEHHNRPAFNAAEKILRQNGYDVFNPAWLHTGDEWTEDELMAIGSRALCLCDAIVQLPGWERSAGASYEYNIAHARGMGFLKIVGKDVWKSCGKTL